jgi:tRNA threonylcarbamoyladenosine biosynthesis protein TsaE
MYCLKTLTTLVDEPALLALAASLARHWLALGTPPLALYLAGDLGAGKTTFTRGFVQACGHKGVVKSPTYTLVEPYELPAATIYHFDLYRLSDPTELEFTGARDCFDGQAACLVEWPERAGKMLPAADLACELAVEGESRRLRMQAGSATGSALLAALQPDVSL